MLSPLDNQIQEEDQILPDLHGLTRIEEEPDQSFNEEELIDKDGNYIIFAEDKDDDDDNEILKDIDRDENYEKDVKEQKVSHINE